MGMDGLSIANTGIIKEATSADYANKTEQSIRTDAMTEAQQVQSMSVNPRIKRKDEEEDADGKQKKSEEETFEDGLVEENEEEPEESSEELDLEDVENPNKDFYVKLNVKDDIIELYESSSGRMIETISGNELGELVQKLNMASGIFVNKKV